MLKFLDGIKAGLMMSAAGVAADQGAGGGQQPANSNFLSALPETLRAHPAFAEVKDVGDLATRYADTQKPFAERLPEKIRGEAAFKDIKDLDGLANSYFNAQKMIGLPKDRVLALPAPDADAKAWDEVWGRLGRPETADKYVVPKRADGKDYSETDLATQKVLLQMLHEAGAPQRLIDNVVPKWNEFVDGLTAADATKTKADLDARVAALKTKWGAAANDKSKLANDAILHLDQTLNLGGALAKEFDGAKIEQFPALAEVFAHIGGMYREDGVIGKGGSGGQGDMLSPAEATQQINALHGDEKFMQAYKSKDHPGHKDAVDRMMRLYEMQNPPKQAV